MCAPLWDSARGDFTGAFTASDLCDILRIFYKPDSASTALLELSVSAWREFAGSIEGIRKGLSSPHLYSLAGGGGGGAASTRGRTDTVDSTVEAPPPQPHPDAPPPPRRAHRVHSHLISVHPEDDLLSVCAKLKQYNIHHMPVVDTDKNAVVAILSHRNLLQHVLKSFSDTRRMFDHPLKSLGVGSFGDVVVVPDTASVISVLNVLAERRISAVPVVSPDTGALLDVYSREDVAFLSNDPSLMVLDAPVGDVRRAQAQMTGVSTVPLTCSAEDTLQTVLERLAGSGGHSDRLVCVDGDQRVTGIVSLSDVFAWVSSGAELGPGPPV